MDEQLSFFTRKEVLYTFKFLSKSQVFIRDCIFSKKYDEYDVKAYLAESVHVSLDSVKLLKYEEVLIIEELLDKNHKVVEGYIDSHWLDETVYIVEIQQASEYIDYMIVAGIGKEKDVEMYLKKRFPNGKIRVFDFKDVWINRSEIMEGERNETASQQ